MSNQDPRPELRGSVLRHSEEWHKSFANHGHLPEEEITHRIGVLALMLDDPKTELSPDDTRLASQLRNARIDDDDYPLVRNDHRIYAAEEVIRQLGTEDAKRAGALTEWMVLYEGFKIWLQKPAAVG